MFRIIDDMATISAICGAVMSSGIEYMMDDCVVLGSGFLCFLELNWVMLCFSRCTE